MFPKKKRIVDPECLERVKKLPCAICKKSSFSDPHHITTRGAGGGDTEDNVMPLCRKHHHQWHWLGIKTMIRKYNEVAIWLLAHKRYDIMSRLSYKQGGKNGMEPDKAS